MRIEEGAPSPFGQMIGAGMDEMREGDVRMSLVLQEKHTNPNGVVHGGVLCTLMDEACGAAVMTVRGMEAMLEAPHATVDMNVSFLAGARPGDQIIIEGRSLRVGRSVTFAEAEVSRTGREGLVAKGRFTFIIPGKQSA